ncbi:glyoxalase bleomycin resistance family [Fusarium globosum]|uniref:Glyoxalase bleomycin resistance family n=1 Tax=Fusarium globosum TaxID=78864 RepID=A0A8H6DJY5_9HYPO|nr:glyoxalase bleomycin resistance family [Fusarium globosum]
MSQLEPTNRPINHIAISCPDIEGLVKWYKSVLGFEVIGDIQHCIRSKDPAPFETIFVSYPASLKELKFAILTTGNGVCIECFQFINPPPKPRDEDFEYTRAGVFHICVTDRNPEILAKKIVDEGGKMLGGWMDYSIFGLEGHKGIYTQDPWGNVVEIMSLSLERVSSTGTALMNAAKTATAGKL